MLMLMSMLMVFLTTTVNVILLVFVPDSTPNSNYPITTLILYCQGTDTVVCDFVYAPRRFGVPYSIVLWSGLNRGSRWMKSQPFLVMVMTVTILVLLEAIQVIELWILCGDC